MSSPPSLRARPRARTGVDVRVPHASPQAELDALGPDGRRELVDAFVAAWERADVAALLELLADDARFTLAFACYQGQGGDQGAGRFRLGAINVVGLRGGRVAELAGFIDPALHRHFGLPEER